MSNPLIEEYRASNQDPRSDEELTLALGEQAPTLLDQYPDFAADYANLKRKQTVDAATIPGEFSKGLGAGYHGMLSSSASALALASDWAGAQGAKDWWMEAAKAQDEASAESAPAVSKWEDANTIREKLLFGAQGLGQTVPSMAEMAAASALGGGVGALSKVADISELFARKAAKSLLKTGVEALAEKGIIKEAAKDAVKDQLGRLAAGETLEVVSPEVTALIRAESRNAAIRHGQQWAGAVNAYGLSSGEIYNNVASNPNVSPETARNAATLWGIASAAPDTFLPAYVTSRLFPRAGHAASGIAASIFKDGVVEIGGEAVTEGFQEVIDILAERDAEGKKLDDPFTKADWSRVKNSAIIGGLGGGLAVPITVLGGERGKPKKKDETPPLVKPLEEVPPPPADLSNAGQGMIDVAALLRQRQAFGDQGSPGASIPGQPLPDFRLPPPVQGISEADVNDMLQQASMRRVAAGIPGQPNLPTYNVTTALPNPNEQIQVPIPPAPAAPSNVQPSPAGEAVVQGQLRPGVPTPEVPQATAPIQAAVPQNPGALATPIGSAEQPVIPGQPQAASKTAPPQGSGIDGVPVTPPPIVVAPAPPPGPIVSRPEPHMGLLAKLDAKFDPETGLGTPNTMTTVMPVAGDLLLNSAGKLGWNPKLGEFLVQESFPERESGKQKTHRATAFLNNQTGEVVVLGTYKVSGKATVSPMPGKKKGVDIRDFMTPEKDRIWTPIESIRLAKPEKGLSVVFPSMEAYQKFSVPANEMMRGAKSKSEAVSANMRPGGFNATGDVVEVAQDNRTAPEEYSEQERLHDTIVETLPRKGGLIDLNPTVDQIEAGVRSDIGKKGGLDAWMPALIKARNDLISENENFDELKGPEQHAAVTRRVAEEIRDGLGKGIYADSAGKGRSFQDVSGGDGPAQGTLFSRPESSGSPIASTPEVRARFGNLIGTLQNIPGLSVRTLQAVAAELGSFTKSERLITLALFDAQNPTHENLRLALHEAAHVLFAGESPEVQARILRAIESLTDADLGLASSPDPRIRSANPAGLSREVLAQERLVEALALAGLGREPAAGIAARIIRFIKDLYFRAAMAMQKALGRPESSAMALAYVRNRFEQMETESRNPLLGFITPPGDWFLTQQRERAYAAMPDVLYSKPVSQSISGTERPGDRVMPEVIINQRIATLNAQKAIEAQAMPIVEALPRVTAAIEESGLSPIEWFRNVVGIANPDGLIRDAVRTEDPATGKPVNANPAMALGAFNSSVNNNLANNAAFSWLREQFGKIGRKRQSLIDSISKIEKSGDDRIEALNRSISDYANVNGMTDLARKDLRRMLRKLYKDVAGESKKFGMISQQLIELGEPGDDLQTWAPIFRKLFTGTELGANRLLDTLNILAEDTRIDMSRRADSIRSQMRKTGDDKFEPFLGDSKEGKALLATAIAYARTNRSAAWIAQLQKMNNLERRARINAQLKELLGDRIPQAAKKINELVDTGVLENNLRQAFLADRRDIRNLAKRQQQARAELDAVEAALPYWEKKVNDLAGQLQIRTDKPFGHGFQTWVPKSNNSTESEMRGNPVTVSIKKGDQITTPGEIQEWLDAMTGWLAESERNGQMDSWYYQIKSDRDTMLRDGVINPSILNTTHSVTRLFFMGFGERLKAFGTIAGRLVNAAVTRFTGVHENLRREYLPMAFEVMRRRHSAMNILTRGRKGGLSIENYWSNFYEPAVKYLEDNRTILEAHSGDREKQWDNAFTKIFNALMLNPAARSLMAGSEREFMAALRAHIEANDAISRSFSGKLNDEGVGVYDERIGATRMRLERGITTVPRTISGVFKNLFETMIQNGWDGNPSNPSAGASASFANIAQTYQQLGATQAWDSIKGMFSNPDIQRDFASAIANMPTQSRFLAPLDRDGVSQREIHPGIVQSAWGSAGGNIITFAENLYALENGSMDKGAYVQQVLETFGGYFDQMKRIAAGMDPQRFYSGEEFSTMVPGFMVNARHVEDMPSEWFRHLDFDEDTIQRATGKVASEIAFGVDGAKLDLNYRTLLEEVRADVSKLDNAIEKVNATVLSDSRKVRDKALADILGSESELKRLRALKQKEKKILIPFKKDIVTFFRGANSPTKPLRFTQQVANFMSGLMVNQLGSAISNMSDVLSSLIPLGTSATTIKGTLRQTKGITSEIARSFAQAFGISIDRSSREYQRMVEYGQTDPHAMWRNTDLLLRQTGPDESTLDRISQGLRKTQRAIQFGINPKEGKVSPFRPLAPFSQVAFNSNQEAVINWVRDVQDYAGKASEYLKTSGLTPRALANMTLEEWADELDLSKPEADTFKKLFSILRDDAGMSFYRMARDGAANVAAGTDLLSKRSFLSIQGAALKATGNETSIATMPPGAFNNSVLRLMMPLLSWTFRRAREVSALHLDASGNVQMAAIMKGLLTIAIVGAGGLAVSAMVDLYNEELLNKRRNLRRLTLDQDPGELAMALLEHSARVGTFGLWGDLLNSTLNTGTGQGDNRGISLDSRVVAVNSLSGLIRGISTWRNQNYTADYAGVIRPIAYSVGGGGMIQYLQLANNLAGLDNAESRATARTNAGNWLRAVGREQGLEINQNRGGYSTPTPMTPLISRMTLAAYGNDAGDFNQAFREAVAEAKREGKDDPVKYVRTAFMGRAPLRSVFRNPMTEQDYRKVLSAMPDDGRQAVQDAVRMFDGYTLQIGGTPHELKREKAAPAVSLRMPSIGRVNLRSAAAAAMSGGYGF